MFQILIFFAVLSIVLNTAKKAASPKKTAKKPGATEPHVYHEVKNPECVQEEWAEYKVLEAEPVKARPAKLRKDRGSVEYDSKEGRSNYDMQVKAERQKAASKRGSIKYNSKEGICDHVFHTPHDPVKTPDVRPTLGTEAADIQVPVQQAFERKVPVKITTEKHQQSFVFSDNSVVNGVIWSEILKGTKGKRK